MFITGLDIPDIIAFAITAILAFAYHEFAHAIVADRLGDPTPRSHGRISLNPFVHLDLMGIVFLFLAGFGWAVTPVNPNRLRGNPRTAMAIVAVAGPAANLLMALIYAVPLRLDLLPLTMGGEVFPSAFLIMVWGLRINVLLMVFNLLPIPPLDGFTILLGLLPPDLAYRLEPMRQYGTLLLIALIFFLPLVGINILGQVISPLTSFFMQFLSGLPFI